MKYKMKYVAPLAAALLLAACGAKEEGTISGSASAPETEEAAEAGPYTVVDDRGTEVSFEEVPETIVSLQPSNTEILFALGVGDKIIGATDYDNYPEAAQDIERVSDSYAFNAERIIEMNPDVVIAYTIGDEAQVEQLEAAGVKVFVISSATSFEDVYGDIEQLGDVVGQATVADRLVEDIKVKISEVQEKTADVAKSKIYFEIAPSPDIWTTGSETFQQEILEAAGVENIFADQKGWFSVATEDVIARNPEQIFTTVYYTEDPVAEIKARASWDQIQAVQNDLVFKIDADMTSRPGPRIGEAVELVAKTAYPELFK
ncbi:ABC transporter substrate-binding protein [Lysinibacillus sp. LZ02]|uniref:ABC transporter substrate-binding protein n=1 Tax=Lysinibacillus sp. LZ02 TaxID=3420668 RepID=UPI003D36605F